MRVSIFGGIFRVFFDLDFPLMCLIIFKATMKYYASYVIINIYNNQIQNIHMKILRYYA